MHWTIEKAIQVGAGMAVVLSIQEKMQVLLHKEFAEFNFQWHSLLKSNHFFPVYFANFIPEASMKLIIIEIKNNT